MLYQSPVFEEGEDSTHEEFTSSEQLFTNKGNLFGPSMGPGILFTRGQGKFQKQYIKTSKEENTKYERNKRIEKLVKRLDLGPAIEQEVIQIVVKYIESLSYPCKKLNAVVASAIYMVKRMEKSVISLKQITDLYKVRQKDISKYMQEFKKTGICEELPEASIMDFFIIFWHKIFALSDQTKIQTGIENTDFQLNPEKVILFNYENSEKIPLKKPISYDPLPLLKDKFIKIAKTILLLPEIEFSKQGKMPQTVAAGIFSILAEHFGLKITPREISEKVDISYPTVLEARKLIVEAISLEFNKLSKKSGVEGDTFSGFSQGTSETENKLIKEALDWIVRKSLCN